MNASTARGTRTGILIALSITVLFAAGFAHGYAMQADDGWCDDLPSGPTFHVAFPSNF
jgi:hypothetical protein